MSITVTRPFVLNCGLRQTPRIGKSPRYLRTKSLDSQNNEVEISSPELASPPPAQLADAVPDVNQPSSSLLAGGAVSFGIGLFLFTRVFTTGPSFADLESQSTPYEIAQSNGKPTVIEFYAKWCEVCREMLPDTLSAEAKYKDQINFVALNVENGKWTPEMLEYGVDGIPHFSFLDSEQTSQGTAIGRLPKRILDEDLKALVEKKPLPYKQVSYTTSSLKKASQVMKGPSMPRDHGP
eukprot:g7582.t1